MKHAPKLVLCLLLARAAAAQETVHPIELPRVTMDELAAVPLRERPHVIHQRWLPPFANNLFAHDHPFAGADIAAPASLAPPPTALIFQADTSDELSPADASGAVGPQHVVAALNSGIVVQDRSGTKLQKVSLSQFWFSAAPISPYYDPRVVYDSSYDRWVIACLSETEGIMFAVSETGDPRGAWRRYRYDENDLDYTHLVLAGDTIVIGTEIFRPQTGLYLVVPRSDAYSKPESLTATRLDLSLPWTPVSTDSRVLTNSGQKWLVLTYGTGVGWRPLGGSVARRDVSSPYPVTSPDRLPQAGGGPLDASFSVAESAVEHRGWIYVVSTQKRGQQHVIQWCRFDPITGAAEWNLIADPDPAVSYAYPSMAVNPAGAILIGFGIFSGTQYPSSGYVYRTPLGNWTTTGRITTGDSPFTPSDRWGDYTTTVVDPVDRTSFWTLQMHTRNQNWETSWASVTPESRRRSVRH